MPARPKHTIASKDIEKLLKDRGLKTRRSANHIIVSAAKGSAVFPVDTELSLSMMAIIREGFIKLGILSKDEFDHFIMQHSPLLEKIISVNFEAKKSGPLYVDVRDSVLKQRLSNLGSPPFDTLIRESGVVLEDRLRNAANQEDKNLHGVTLIDALFNPTKAKIVFSQNPAEQDGARLLYRGAIQLIRNPAMHKIIEYPENEARLFINVIDSLLQLLSEAKSNETID